jgi:hypothetical protein
MTMIDRYCHTATAEVAVEARTAFNFMADGIKQGRWALGSWERREAKKGLFVGTSLFDGKETWVRISADPERLLVDYLVGRSPEALLPRNSARIVPGPATKRSEKKCLVTLMTWRLADMTDEAWEQLCVTHETELFMIKGLLERSS